MQELKDLDCSIQCTWAEPFNRIIIGFDGQVHPCCYFYNSYIKRNLENSYNANHELLIYYEENSEKFNIFNHDLEDIINSTYFKKLLPESWVNNPISQCSNHCTKLGSQALKPRILKRKEE